MNVPVPLKKEEICFFPLDEREKIWSAAQWLIRRVHQDPHHVDSDRIEEYIIEAFGCARPKEKQK